MKSDLKKIVVIGSGFGGIAAALRLKAKNYNVTLVEKHNDLGGRAKVFKKNGFTFDGGPTVITAPYLIDELFELFNKNSKDYINIVPLKTWYRFVFDDYDKHMKLNQDMKDLLFAISEESIINRRIQ